MGCFACGTDFDLPIKGLLRKYKEEYDTVGTKRVYFKYKKNGDIMIMRTEAFFKTVHKKLLTKKAVKDGAEFALIQEFGKAANTKVLGDSSKK